MNKLLHGFCFWVLLTVVGFTSKAQTVITTGTPSSSGALIGSNPVGITFVLENTNGYAITVSDIEMYRAATTSGITMQLYYSSISLSGTFSAIATNPDWTLITTITASTVTSTAIHPTFTGLNFNIPANTTYRFAVVLQTTGCNYGSTGSTPSYSGGGVNLHTGQYQINSNIVGVLASGGNFSLGGTGAYFWRGTINFAPAQPCIAPPTAGTATVTAVSPCAGNPITLNLTGNTGGLTQTYQWETSTSPSGPFTPLGSAQSGAQYNLTAPNAPGTIHYYRCIVDCSSLLDTSTVISINIPAYYPGGTYTINSALPTGGTNFQSFSDAATAINCGITGPIIFNVSPGSYTDRFYLDSIPNTSVTNTITVNGNGATLVNTSSNSNDRATVRLYGTDHVTINNLNIVAGGTGSSQYGFGVQLLNNADSNTISNCTVLVDSVTASTNFTPISISGSLSSATQSGSGCDGTTITGNSIAGGYYSITALGASSTSLIGNTIITNNSIRNFYNNGIYISYSNGTLVENNDIHRANRTNSTTYAGVAFFNASRNARVSKNKIHNAFDQMTTNTSAAYPIYFSSADGTLGNENRIVNNLIYNINGAGIIYGLYNTSSDYCLYYHNTISLDDPSTFPSAVARGIYQTTAASGLEFKNNVITIKRGGTGVNHGIYMNTPATTYTSNNNIIYVNGGSMVNHFGYSGTDYTTLSAWQGGVTQDAASSDLDPSYFSPTANNYQPTVASLDNLGTYVNVNDDINGNPRSTTTPDIGAYEFAIPACSGTPNAGTASGPTDACAGKGFSVYATGLSIGIGISYDWQSNDGTGWVTTGGTSSSYTVTTGITTSTDFRVVTYCSNTNQYDTSSVWTVALKPFYYCYCSPLLGNTLHTSMANYLTNVNIPGTNLNNSSTSYGAGAYTQYLPNVAAQTATVFENVAFTLNTVMSTSLATTEAWIDWDHSGTFDASEYYPLTHTGTAGTVSITPPLGVLTGMTGLRIRVAYNSAGAYGGSAACSNITAGRETEDYVITVLPAPTCPSSGALASTPTTTNATLSWTPTSSASQWQVEYGVGNFALGTGTRVISTSATFATPTIPYDTSFSFFVRDICGPGDTSLWSARKSFFLIPPNDDCANAIDLSNGLIRYGSTGAATQTDPACNNTTLANDVWYKFSTGASGGSVTLDVTTGVIDVVIQALSGTCGAFTPMIPTASTTLGTNGCIDGPAAGQEFGTYTVAANSTYYFRVYGYGNAAPGAEGSFRIFASGAPLAVKLEKITAVNVGASNRIDWNTLSEERSDKFELQRSIDGKQFTTIHEQQANGAASRYTYLDNNAVKGMNYYRLRMLPAGGNAAYSETVSAFVKSAGFEVEAFPNPVSHELTVKVSGVQGADATVQVTDVTGKVVQTVKMNTSIAHIDMTSLANGIYLIKYSDANHTQTIKVNKQ